MDVILYPTTGTDAMKKCWVFTDIEGTSINIGGVHNVGSFVDIFSTSWLNTNNLLMPMQGWCVVQNNTDVTNTTFKNFCLGSTGSAYLQSTKSYAFPKYTFGYWTYPCVSSGKESNANLQPDPTNPNEPTYHEIIKIIPKEYLSGDFNGDGITDVIIVEKEVSFSYYTGGCNGYNATQTYPGGKTYFLDLDSRLTSNYLNISGYVSTTSNSKFTVADVNGDGKSDLMVFNSGNVKVYTLNDNKQLELIINHDDSSIISDKPHYMGDFNGDGKADFVIPQANNVDSWSFFFSKSNGFQKTTTSIGIGYYTPSFGYYGILGYSSNTYSLVQDMYVANDFNGDGKTDILHQLNFTIEYVMTDDGANYSNYGDPQITKLTLLENKFTGGNSISFNKVFTNAQFGGIRRYPIPVFLDHNHANQNLEYALISGNNIRTFKSTKDNRLDTRLKEIILGNGEKNVITYKPLNTDEFSYDNAFEPSTYTDSYPNYDIKVATGFQVVSLLEQVSANQYKKQKFNYYGAVTNLKGLGFLGFRGLARTNWYNDDYPAITSVTKHDLTKRGAITETYSVRGQVYGNFTAYTPTNFISKSLMIYSDQLLSNKVFKINNTSSTSFNGLENTSVTVSSSFDTYNNPLTSTTLTKNGTTTEKTETVTIEYFNQPTGSGSSYYIGRLKQKNSSVTHNGNTMTGEEKYTYNSAHLVSKIEKKGHLTNYLTEENTYDAFGNIIQKKITAVGLTPRITSYSYDGSKRFLMSATDIEGLVTNYTYNTSNGLVLTQALPSNSGFPLTTTYQYDVWGKKIIETDYLGKKMYYSYDWLSPGTSGIFVNTITGDDNSASFSWFDDLGHKTADGYRTINGGAISEPKNIYKSYEFDIYDRVTKAYDSHLSIFPLWSGLHSETEYDDYGRLKKVTESTGKTTNITYNGLTTTTTDGVSNTATTKNSLGNVVSMTDNGGTITYQHYANGNLKQSNFGGVVIEIEQDGWGRKKKLNDPSAGIYEYEYNEFGEITKEITPKGITEYTLDNFGKVTEKKINGTGSDPTNMKTIYTYDSSTKLLTSTNYDDYTSGFHATYSYEYDNYKRLWRTTEFNPDIHFQSALFFDAFGRVEKEYKFANHLATGKTSTNMVKNTYKNGHHYQILDDATNTVLWQTDKVNGKGQLTEAYYGNGISVNNTYDQYGFPTQFKHNQLVGTNMANVLTLKTTFNTQRGNLINRNSSLFNLQENYTYDNLDRLTSWSNENTVATYTFDSTVEGFVPTATTATLSLYTTGLPPFSTSKLKVTTTANFDGTKKLVKTNAIVGNAIKFEGTASFTTGRTNELTENYFRYYVIERNPSTGATVETEYTGFFGVNNFSFQHTVLQYPEVYLKIVAGSDFSTPTSITFYLDDIKISEIKTSNQSYDDLGRIDENETGTYNYTIVNPVNGVPKHFQQSSTELTAEYANYFQNYRSNLDITYNVFKSPIDINEEGHDKLSFIYNMNQQRTTMYYGSTNSNKLLRPYRKYYSADGGMEVKYNLSGSVEFITYIGGDAYSAPIIQKSNGTTQEYLYLHRDYLGSIVAITNQTGAIVEKRHFDAWGNITNIQDGAGNTLTALTVLERGYTGHEHLQGVNLIHMNGRLYDPVVHRFLQPDNFVQDPYNTQNYNRYSYVLNNPLKYTDPSGEWLGIDDLIAGAIGGVINLGVNIWQGNIKGNFWEVFGKGLAAFGSGFAAGTLSLYGPAGWVAGGAILGATNSWLSGADPIEGALTGGFSGLVGGALGTWASGAISGVVINGIKVASPLIQGAVIGSLSGSITGGIMGFGMALIQTGDFTQSLKAGKQGLLIGAITGGIAGGGGASAQALKNNTNPFTGKDLKPLSSEMVKARHHTSFDAMNKIRNSSEMIPSRDSGFGVTGVDFEISPQFNGNQNFGNQAKGAFIEMQFPKSITIPNPSPLYPYNVRVVTSGQNLLITPEFRPKYYININN